MNSPSLAKLRSLDNRLIPRRSSSTVILSEYPLWFAFSIAFFISISETIFGFTLKHALVLKHIPLLIFLPSFALYIVGRNLMGAPRLDSKGWFSALWPFLLLGVFATLGSLYARIVLDIRETFLILGIYMLISPLFFIWAREVGNTSKIVKPFILLWGVSSFVALAGAAAYFRKAAVLHEIEFVVLPFFVYLFFSQRQIAGKVFSLLLLVAATILTQKLTGYIIGLAAMCYISWVSLDLKVLPRWRSAVRVLSVAAVIVFVGLAVLGFFYFREYLPSGNMDVRLHQYANVFSAFLESPIWGQAYTAGSGEMYIEYTRSLNIPTHSDILDLLKQGGGIAFGLWLVGVFLSVRLLFRCAIRNSANGAFFHAMAFFTVSMALSCAINPLFLKPTYAFIIWGSLALALGVATDTRKGQFNES